MPKLDSQRRLIIKKALIEFLNLDLPCNILVCYDFKVKAIYLCSNEFYSNRNVINISNIDHKGRFVLTAEFLRILNASKDDFFFVFARGKKIYIIKKGMGGTEF